ncbi:MAG: replication-associated recombination protein A [bacterium]
MNRDLFHQHDSSRDDDPGRETSTGAVEDASRRSPKPLADRMRPQHLDEMVGQTELLGPTGPLRRMLDAAELHSLLLWGPPGCGKTTLARLMASQVQARFLEYSAVAVGAKELKAVMAEAEKLLQVTGQRTTLFLDEIHRFNKAQQDTLLPWVERGDVTLIGATTENPSFEVNTALLSRLRLFVLSPLGIADVQTLLERALTDPRGLAERAPRFAPDALTALAELSEGDARCALNLLETVATVVLAADPQQPPEVSAADLEELIQQRATRYDKSGEEHFNLISALHKSLRNSDVQAALYWLTRMLEGGEDPLYIARRLVRFASEDVGLADPAALPQALAARDAVHFIGLPEGTLALAQATVYLALAPKSNALYSAFKATTAEVQRGHNPPVPSQLRNAPTRLMKNLGFGRDYVYAHDTPAGIADLACLPDALSGRIFYRPKAKGFETELAERMARIEAWRQRQTARKQTPTGGDE